MAVEIHPNNVLAFQRPLTQMVKRTLSISNEQTAPVAFKVKTTAPKQYCVRPNAGRIEPGEKVDVQVLLQGMKEEPPADYKCKDKFLIQSALIVSEFEGLSLPELWTSLEKEDKASIHEQKIRCAFTPAEESATVAADDKANEADTTTTSHYINAADDHSRNSTSSTPQQNGQTVNGDAKPMSQIASDARSQPAAETATQAKDNISASTAAAGGAVAGAAGAGAAALAAAPSKAKEAVSGGTATSTSDASELQKQLDAARAEIEKLKLQLKKAGAEGGSSSRSVAFKEEPSAALSQSIKEAQVEGVAFNKVVMISALVFVFTWLFF